jgi:hypothetical protein
MVKEKEMKAMMIKAILLAVEILREMMLDMVETEPVQHLKIKIIMMICCQLNLKRS